MIGIAVGTVLLPEMARRLAAGDESGARHAQNRAIELTLLLSIPFVVAFLLMPDLIMRALFGRGAFTDADAQAAGVTLAAYAIGLFPFVLLRSATVTFLSRGDTMTPVKALGVAVAVNVALKILLIDYAQVGLAFATSVGGWVNLALLLWFAARQNLFAVDAGLLRSAPRLVLMAAVLALALWLGHGLVLRIFAPGMPLRDEFALMVLVGIGAVVYVALLMVLFGRPWLATMRAAPPLPLRR